MAVTVTDDFTVVDSAEAVTGWAVLNADVGESFAVRGNAAQGTNALGSLVVGTGIGGLTFDTGAANVDVTDQHILIWLFPAGFSFDTEANGGLRARISTDAPATTNFGEWSVGGEDTAIAYKLGTWRCYAVDVLKPFDFVTGTPPAITAVRSFAGAFDIVAVEPEASQMFVDQIKRGTGITITGGAATPRGSPEVAANDDTNGRGTFRDVAGVYYVMGRVTIGDVTAATNSAFDDTNKVWVFQDLPVSATFHVLEFVGGTGTNRATFGTGSGTGNAKEGSGGNAIVAGGAVPFTVKAVDADITVEHFGGSFTGPVALKDDAVRNFKQEDNSGGPSFVDDTRDANDATANDVALFPAGAGVNDAAYFGHDERIDLLKINVGTAGAGTYTVTWEYWNGSAWAALIDVTDGTNAFKTTGLQTVSYAISDNWAKTTVDTDNRYWIRARRDGGTVTTNPLMTQCFASMGGWVEWEHTNAESIRWTYTNMDTIRVRSSAKLKKTVIVNSVAPAKSAALSFGPTDPATDTVRDITINGGINGILLQPTAPTTYNLRNIKISGHTGKKVRIESVSQAITINTLDGGDSLVAGDLDLVGGILAADVTIVNNPVTLTINVDDNTGANLQNARVLAEAGDGTGDLPFEESVTITRSASTATVSHTAHGLVAGDVAVIRGANEQEYNGPFAVTIVNANSYTYTVSGAPASPATGTITSTGAMLHGLTDVNGQISRSRALVANQPLRGFIRKSTASPRFKTFSLAGNVVDNANGLTVTVRMILDE